MPPACENAEVTGVDMTVCDSDAAPEVTMSDALTARVHRTGQLADFAAVNVTVHCIPPAASKSPTTAPAPPAPTTPPAPPSTTDARSTYEMFSDELISNEEIPNETPPNYFMDYDLTSNELMTPTTAAPTTVTPPLPEATTLQFETTSTTELVTTTRKKKIRPKVKKPRTLKVTIKIAPMKHDVKEKDGVLKSVGAEPLSHKDKPDQEVSFQSSEYPSYMETPPRFAVDAPARHKRRHRHGPRPPRAPRWLAERPAPYDTALYGAVMSPYSVLGSTRLLGPRLLYWLRHRPTVFLSHY